MVSPQQHQSRLVGNRVITIWFNSLATSTANGMERPFKDHPPRTGPAKWQKAKGATEIELSLSYWMLSNSAWVEQCGGKSGLALLMLLSLSLSLPKAVNAVPFIRKKKKSLEKQKTAWRILVRSFPFAPFFLGENIDKVQKRAQLEKPIQILELEIFRWRLESKINNFAQSKYKGVRLWKL